MIEPFEELWSNKIKWIQMRYFNMLTNTIDENIDDILKLLDRQEGQKENDIR